MQGSVRKFTYPAVPLEHAARHMNPKQLLKNATLTLVLGLALAGCSSLDLLQLDRENVLNGEGHVIGHKETLLDERTGKEVTRVELYIPLLNPSGELVAYEEPAKGGSIIRDLNGKVIGTRWDDPRGRGNNPGSRGVTVTYPPRSVKSTGNSAAGSTAPQ
jgi:hypothetical protein